VIEWVRYLVEWMHYVLRNVRDARLSQRVNKVMYPERGQRSARAVKMARRYIALMTDPDCQQRHRETLIRAGY
jgi:hypothetical protein